MSENKSEVIRHFILKNIEKNPKDIVFLAIREFGISRQAISRHVRALVDNGKILFNGTTKDRVYYLKNDRWIKEYRLDGRLDEDRVWRKDIRPYLGELPRNILDIWAYSFSEMLNNVIDHSEGSTVCVAIEKNAIQDTILIQDNGVGIFRKIQKALSLDDENDAILELAKGKLTTDSKRHSGEGIFFTSRSVDFFKILSGGVKFCHTGIDKEDLILGRDYLQNESLEGTTVILCVENDCKRTMKEVYDIFTTNTNDEFGFDKTIIPVHLAKQGDEMLISRSQAKRLLTRFDRFRVVVLDFEGVSEIGQAFADEVFRVFQNENPQISIVEINANDQIKKMINRTIPVK